MEPVDDAAIQDVGPKYYSPKSLRQMMVEYITAHPQLLIDDPSGTVGVLPVDVLRSVLVNCTEDQLSEIEEICSFNPAYHNHMPWYTWHLWHKIYCRKFGNPFASGAADKLELQPLPGDRPEDYGLPPGLDPGLEGDWRLQLEVKQEEREMRLAHLKSTLKSGYRRAEAHKAQRTVQETEKLPPHKRSRTHQSGGFQRNSAQTLNKYRNINPKLLKALGMAPKAGSSVSLGSSSSSGSGSSGSSGTLVRRPLGSCAGTSPAALAPRSVQQQQQPRLAASPVARQQQQQQQHLPQRSSLAPKAGGAALPASGGSATTPPPQAGPRTAAAKALIASRQATTPPSAAAASPSGGGPRPANDEEMLMAAGFGVRRPAAAQPAASKASGAGGAGTPRAAGAAAGAGAVPRLAAPASKAGSQRLPASSRPAGRAVQPADDDLALLLAQPSAGAQAGQKRRPQAVQPPLANKAAAASALLAAAGAEHKAAIVAAARAAAEKLRLKKQRVQ